MPVHDLLTVAYEKARPKRKGPQPADSRLQYLRRLALHYIHSGIPTGGLAEEALHHAMTQMAIRRLERAIERRP